MLGLRTMRGAELQEGLQRRLRSAGHPGALDGASDDLWREARVLQGEDETLDQERAGRLAAHRFHHQRHQLTRPAIVDRAVERGAQDVISALELGDRRQLGGTPAGARDRVLTLTTRERL